MRRSWGVLALLLIVLTYGVSMAAIAITTTRVLGQTVLRAQLLTNAVATGNGEWIDTTGIGSMSIHVAGITNATVEINGSNAPTRPADATHGHKLNASDIVSDQTMVVEAPMRWIKARVTAWTSGTINVYLEAHAGGR